MTNRMQFTVTGSKARPGEAEITLNMLITNSRRALRIRQRRRVIHAVAWELAEPPWDKSPKAVIELWGIFAN